MSNEPPNPVSGPSLAALDSVCERIPSPPLEQGKVEVALEVAPSLALALVMKDASRDGYEDQERTLFRAVASSGFSVSVESIPPGRTVETAGQLLSEAEAIVHTHMHDHTRTVCFKFHYSVLEGRRGKTLVEERVETAWDDPYGRPVFGLSSWFNPFRFFPSRRLSRDRKQHLSWVLTQSRGKTSG